MGSVSPFMPLRQSAELSKLHIKRPIPTSPSGFIQPEGLHVGFTARSPYLLNGHGQAFAGPKNMHWGSSRMVLRTEFIP